MENVTLKSALSPCATFKNVFKMKFHHRFMLCDRWSYVAMHQTTVIRRAFVNLHSQTFVFHISQTPRKALAASWKRLSSQFKPTGWPTSIQCFFHTFKYLGCTRCRLRSYFLWVFPRGSPCNFHPQMNMKVSSKALHKNYFTSIRLQLFTDMGRDTLSEIREQNVWLGALKCVLLTPLSFHLPD